MTLSQYPLHLLNLTSVRALESKVQKDDNLQFLDARRFRPNIIGMAPPGYILPFTPILNLLRPSPHA